MDFINFQLAYIAERCKQISLLFGIINPIVILIKKNIIGLIMDVSFLLCTILIPVMLLIIIGNIFVILF